MVDYDTRVKELEDEIRKTPYNKATQHHIGRLKAQIARLRQAGDARSGGFKGSGYQVRKSGDGTVILVGFPSAGKSTLLNALTNAESEIGSYAFTTLSVIPGVLDYKGAQIQILDVPGIVRGAATGKGRGKEVLATMRSADLCIIIVDGTKTHEYHTIKEEVYGAGIRLDEIIPDVKITRRSKDGLDIGRTVRTPELTNNMIKDILSTFRIFNAEVVIRTKINADQFIDCIQANKKYMPSVVVINKTDLLSRKQRRTIKKETQPDIFISASLDEGIEELKEIVFNKLQFIRIWMKEPGKEADLKEPLIIRKGSRVKDVAKKIHGGFEKKFKFARITGPSSKFPKQKVGLQHKIRDNDIVELHMR